MPESNNEILLKAGDYELEALLIHTVGPNEIVDLRNFMLELHLYEDIFSASLSGNIVIADAVNLVSSLPIFGDEAITLKIRTPTLEDTPTNIIEKSFNLYSIEDRTSNTEGSQFYKLCFTSIENYVDAANPISKTFRGQTDDVAAKIFEDHIQTERVIGNSKRSVMVLSDTPHRSTITYTSNFWSPFKNLRFVSKRVRGGSLDGSDYLFYESNKRFYFASIESIIESQVNSSIFEEYVLERDSQNIPRRKTGLQYYGNVMPNEVTRIEDLKQIKNIDILDSQRKGLLSSSVFGYDLSTKKFVQKNLDFVDQSKNFYRTSVGNQFSQTIPRNPRTRVNFLMYNSSLYNDYGITDNENLPSGHPSEQYTDRFLFRKSYLNSISQNVFEMVVPGRTDIEVGCLISVLYPTSGIHDSRTKELDTIFDPYLSGLFLVTAIHHKFNNDRHVMTLEIVKNGLNYDMGVIEDAAP